MFTIHMPRDGLPSGDGMYEAGSGDVYIGRMENGLPNGKGEFVYGQVRRKTLKSILFYVLHILSFNLNLQLLCSLLKKKKRKKRLRRNCF